MTLVLIDGLEDATSLDVGSPLGASFTTGRNGNGLSFPAGANSRGTYSSGNLYANNVGFTIGFALKVTAYNASNNMVMAFFGTSQPQTVLKLGTNGSLTPARGNGSDLGTSAASVIPLNTWVYVEIKYLLATGATGQYIVNVNGTNVLNLTGIATNNATFGGTTVASVYLGSPSAYNTTQAMIIDDLYLCVGATPDAFLGDISVETLYPDGNGSANAWVGSDGNSTDNYLLVNETGTPNTANHTKSSTVGQVDEYTLGDLTHTTGTIVAVCHQVYAALGAAGSQTFAIINRRAADTASATLTATSTGYNMWHYVLTADPETSAAWTIANVNSLQTGIKVV